MFHFNRCVLSELWIIAIVWCTFQEDETFEVARDIMYGGGDLSKIGGGNELQLGNPVAHRRVPVSPVFVWSRGELFSKLS